MKAVTSIVLHCAAVTVAAAALPDGSQVVTDPLEGYEIVPMQWKGSIKEGEAPISLNGTIESVISQIRELNPEFELELAEADTATLSKIEERNPSGIICNVGGSGYVDVDAARREQRYLRSLGNSVCGVGGGPGKCARVSCSYGDAIWLCNDNSFYIEPRCSYLADYVDHIIAKCRSKTSSPPCTVRPCGPSWTAYFVRGQEFDSDKYNVIVGRSSC
ncbi:tol [Fusarium mundagurra]|uniref:Tol n=1 Tax=Fusarium mundagurra TaxID=1567541 RepID=A0A8H5YC25_9HYPO|nr:tol [Fusarium mundagurra]